MKKGLVLQFHSRGLLVTGDTWPIKLHLKEMKGRWDPMLQGWLFQFEFKQELLQGLRDNAVPAPVEDRAKVQVVLAACSKGVAVTGETFPVKDFLRKSGGAWDPKLKAWTFQNIAQAQLSKLLKASPDIGTVSIEKPTVSSIVVLEPSARRPVASPANSKPRALTSGSELAKASPTRLNGKQKQLKNTSQPTSHSGKKVVETQKRVVKAARKADGSKEGTQVDKKQQKISCKRTGAHIQTTSVTKKRKVKETKGKIVETRTITVKRVRNK